MNPSPGPKGWAPEFTPPRGVKRSHALERRYACVPGAPPVGAPSFPAPGLSRCLTAIRFVPLYCRRVGAGGNAVFAAPVLHGNIFTVIYGSRDRQAHQTTGESGGLSSHRGCPPA